MFKLPKKIKDDLELTCGYVLDYFQVHHTSSHLKNLLGNHVEYPSFLTLIDVLESYGIANMAMRKNEYQYRDFEVPFVCCIQRSDWSSPSFAVVTLADGTTVEYQIHSCDKQ